MCVCVIVGLCSLKKSLTIFSFSANIKYSGFPGLVMAADLTLSELEALEASALEMEQAGVDM